MRSVAVLVVVAACLLGAAAAASGAPLSPDNQAILAAGLLRRSDFPAGWATGPSGGQVNFARLGPTCRPLAVALSRRIGRQQSLGFEDRATGDRADDTVVLYETPAGTTALFDTVAAPSTLACYQRSARLALAKQGGKGTLRLTVESVAPASVAPAGDQSLSYEATVHATASGQTATVYEQAVFVRVGRAAVSFTFVTDQPSAAAGFTPQIDAVVARLQAAE